MVCRERKTAGFGFPKNRTVEDCRCRILSVPRWNQRLSTLGLKALLGLASLLGVLVSLLGWQQAALAEKYWVYIGTYTGKTSRGIYKVDFDLPGMKIGQPELAAEVRNPSFLALHPSREFLYAVGELQEFEGKRVGAVSAFAIEPGTGRLQLLNQQPSGGTGPCHLTVDASGRWLVVANYGGGTVAVLEIAPDGQLKPPVCVVAHEGQSVHPTRQRQPHPHQVRIAPGTNLVLVPDLGTDRVVLYRLDRDSGKLSPNDPPFVTVPPGSGPRHLTYSQGNRFLFVLNELTATVSVFRCREAVPMELVQTVSALPADFAGENTAAEIVVHPSNRWVFSSNRGHDSIAIFRFHEAEAKLELVGHAPSGGRTPRNFNLDPSGRVLFSANQNTDNVVIYSVDAETGRLTDTGLSFQVGAPVCIIFKQVP